MKQPPMKQTPKQTPVIAIDGPAGAGKGTLACALAEALGFAHLDTGLLYRYVAYKALESPHLSALENALSLNLAELSSMEENCLRTEEISELASKVAAKPEVRKALLSLQRQFGKTPPQRTKEAAKGAVIEGRDIGTVVCPDAELKIFLTAKDEIRAHRRTKQLHSQGKVAIYERVLTTLRDRDSLDRNRSHSPLIPAKDAFFLDSSASSPEETLQKALERARTHFHLT